MKKLLLSSVALCLAVGCGGTAMSPTKLADSASAMRGAEEAGARQVPAAALHLKLAEEQLELAKKLDADGDGEQANRMLARAQIDAELAVALAREGTAKTEAENVKAEIEKAKGGQP